MASSTQRGNDILFLTDQFPNDATIHGRALQTLVADCLNQDLTVTVMSVAGDKKDVWHKGKCRHICLGFKGWPHLKKMQSARLPITMSAALKKLPPHKLLVSDSVLGRLTLRAEKWAVAQSVPHIYWGSKIYPEAANYEGRDHQPDAQLSKKMKKMMKASRYSVVESLTMYKYLSHNGVDTRRMKIISPWGMYPLRTSKKKPVSNKGGGYRSGLSSSSSHLKQDPIDVKFRVLYSGELVRGGVLENVLEAAEILSQDHPEIEFVFSGYGAGMDYLYEQRASRDFSNIKLMPLQPKVNYIGFLESGDVHLVIEEEKATHIMAFQNAMQAYAAARPIVFVGIPPSETADDIRKNGCGKVVKGDNAKAIAQAILHYRNSAEDWFSAHENVKGIDLQGGQSLKEWRALIQQEVRS